MPTPGDRRPPPEPSPARPDGLRDYTLLGLAGLVIVALVLMLDGGGLWSLAPLLTGCLGILTGRGGGPAVTLFVLILMLALRTLLLQIPSWYRPPSTPVTDVLFAAGLLAYVAGHARLLALRSWAVPGDPRRARQPRDPRLVGRWLTPAAQTRRSPTRVGAGELVWFMVSLPAFLLVADLVWLNVGTSPGGGSFGFSPRTGRLLGLAWLGGVLLAAGTAVSAYLGRALASGPESLLFLQDQLWDATRGEQRRITRWVVRERLKRQRREERA